MVDAQAIVALVRRARLDISSEARLQAGLAELLSSHAIPFEREKPLSDQDRPDFLVGGGIALECKLFRKQRKLALFRQLQRYSLQHQVTAIVLVSNISMGLPSEINGKPMHFASLSTGWI